MFGTDCEKYFSISLFPINYLKALNHVNFINRQIAHS